MNINDNIKKLREQKKWSQEEAAERMDMSKNGYAKIERGEVQPSLHRLGVIAKAFGVDIIELFQNEKSLVCLFSENSQNSSNYYHSDTELVAENERLKLAIQHKDELIEWQKNQINLLAQVIENLKK